MQVFEKINFYKELDYEKKHRTRRYHHRQRNPTW